MHARVWARGRMMCACVRACVLRHVMRVCVLRARAAHARVHMCMRSVDGSALKDRIVAEPGGRSAGRHVWPRRVRAMWMLCVRSLVALMLIVAAAIYVGVTERRARYATQAAACARTHACTRTPAHTGRRERTDRAVGMAGLSSDESAHYGVQDT